MQCFYSSDNISKNTICQLCLIIPHCASAKKPGFSHVFVSAHFTPQTHDTQYFI